jgi:mRNA interferase MazF
MQFEFGDIVLVPFPFTNQATSKKRPAVVVSNRAYNVARPDVVVMAVTSQLRANPGLGEIAVVQWQEAGLLKPSTVKPVFATLEQALVLRRLGVLDTIDQVALRSGIGKILG